MKTNAFFLLFTSLAATPVLADSPSPWCQSTKVYFDYSINGCASPAEGNIHGCKILSVQDCVDGQRKQAVSYCVSSRAVCVELATEFENQ